MGRGEDSVWEADAVAQEMCPVPGARGWPGVSRGSHLGHPEPKRVTS